MKRILLLGLIASSTFALPAWALSTDRDQPIEILADRFNGDEVKQTAVYSGNVVANQGSMNLRGARLELHITPKGYRRATVTGNLARFKQQRDSKTQGIEEWIHAQANRIVYDEETDKVTLFGNARLSRTENGIEKDMTSGERIVYDMLNARSEVHSTLGKRVTTIIAPRSSAKDAQPRAKTSLSNSTTLTPSGAKE